MNKIKNILKGFCFVFISILIICALFLLALSLYLKKHINNENVQLTYYEMESEKISESIKIVQISDLHDFQNIDEVVSKTKQENPDVIVTTGDMFDGNRPDLQNTISLYQDLVQIGCPVYYTSGNHEAAKPELLSLLIEKLDDLGVRTLMNQSETVYIKNQWINVIAFDNDTKYSATKMEKINVNNKYFNLVLCHFPENFDKVLTAKDLYYKNCLSFDMNLILTGHAHGGQIRMKDQGIYAPNQGYLPKWTSGIHKITDCEYLVINRGLGNSTFPFRINNQPEITIITINP